MRVSMCLHKCMFGLTFIPQTPLKMRKISTDQDWKLYAAEHAQLQHKSQQVSQVDQLSSQNFLVKSQCVTWHLRGLSVMGRSLRMHLNLICQFTCQEESDLEILNNEPESHLNGSMNTFPVPIIESWASLKHFEHISSRKRSPSSISLTQEKGRFKRQQLPLNTKVLESRSFLENHLHTGKHGQWFSWRRDNKRLSSKYYKTFSTFSIETGHMAIEYPV